jgi:hypothetical protein
MLVCFVIISVEHGLNFVVEGLIIQIINFYCLEVFLRIEVSLSNEESLSQHDLLDLSIVIVHDVIIDITLLLAHFQEISDLFSR